MSIEPFYVSAPGKVIIFGEHAAVFGKPAIAAALSLRAYLLVTPSEDEDEIKLQFFDIDLVHKWNRYDIPWEKLQKYINKVDGLPIISEELIPEIVELLGTLLDDLDSKLHYIACHCFLYLYCNLCNRDLPGMSFYIRSTLPIGAGLGSSASTAVCLASALAVLGGHVPNPHLGLKDKFEVQETRYGQFINDWSLMGEKCFHGNPSGIDNAVATFGGAVMFQRMKNPATPSVRTTMRNFPALKLLLTNTKVPRSTAELVAGVGKINDVYPKISEGILSAIEHISTDAYQIMAQPFFGQEERQTLRQLVNLNHGLLVALGVSHPALEKIKIIGDTYAIGATKLTGAGGGGCAITLVNDDIPESVIQNVMTEFENEGFESFETSLGGKGAGLLTLKDCSDSRVFSPEIFASFTKRSEIEEALGLQKVPNWKFW
jgi:mevalonate kinase